jgi:heme oxygenase (biliverdin-producing, ferredoxin)
LQERTAPLHRRAERSGFIRAMLQGRASRTGYALFLFNLLPAYRALEAGLDRHHGDPVLEGLAEPGLYRSTAIEGDLAALGEGAQNRPRLLPAGAAYAKKVAACAAPGLIAHAYVRYLGDLNGGQILRRLLARTVGLGPAELGFYEFDAIADPSSFRRRYRHALDRAGTKLVEIEPVLEEATAAFALNIALSEAVLEAS